MSEELNVNKISAEVISELAKNAASFVVKKLSKIYKDVVNKEDIDYGTAFEKYLIDAERHIGMAKTILYGQTPHYLYSFFECMEITNRRHVVDTSDVNNILDIGNKIIITGTGGIGKSMLMKHFFLNTIHTTSYIPILVELRGLNEYAPENISIEKFIYSILGTFGFKLEEEYYRYSLETGCYLILFDGYDEVKNANSQKVTQEIIDFSNRYSENHIILSSRPLDEFVGWSDFKEYSTVALNKEQALSLISKLDYDTEIKNKFYKQLDEELFDKYESFASNPLLLTIMLMTFEERVSIPDSKTDFYEQAFSTLFHKHDAMKKGKYKREKLSGLGYEDFKKVFSYFCFRSFFKNQYEFTEKSALENIQKAKEKVYSYGDFRESDYLEDMTKAVCMLVHEGLNYRFSHRSFQEYFAAVYTTQLSDEEQHQFISSWLKAMSDRMTTDFLDTLCELQPDRFMKNILYNGLCELYDLYEANGRSAEWFIEYMYSGISVHFSENRGERIYVQIKQSYYHTLFVCMLHYLHYKYEDMDNDVEYRNVIVQLKKKYGKKIRGISFEQLKEDALYDEVKKAIKWITQRMHYVFDELDKIDINTFGRKRKFESMLDEL
jgi:predicted NACHT family NTPase